MSIELRCETLLSFHDAAELLPTRRRGSRLHISTLYRWAIRGCRGHRLETIVLGGQRVTSLEALQRFFDKLTAVRSPLFADATMNGSPRQAAASAALDAEGIR